MVWTVTLASCAVSPNATYATRPARRMLGSRPPRRQRASDRRGPLGGAVPWKVVGWFGTRHLRSFRRSGRSKRSDCCSVDSKQPTSTRLPLCSATPRFGGTHTAGAFTRAETSAFLDAQMQKWDEVGFGCWITALKPTMEVIGYVGLSVPMFLPEILPAVEVGWRFSPLHWGKGYASEGATAGLGGASEPWVCRRSVRCHRRSIHRHIAYANDSG